MATQYQGTGRRKTSVARVRLVDGSGKFIINKRDMDEYFDYETLKIIAKAPLNITETLGKFDVFVNVYGGGFTGQAGAIRHGISRALLEVSDEYRPIRPLAMVILPVRNATLHRFMRPSPKTA